MPEIHLWHWGGFGTLVACLLALDLLVFHRKAHAPTLWESAGWSAFWISLGLAFGGLLWWWRGPEVGMQFLTGFIIEKSLSMDNIFVFAVIFRFFGIPLMYQYRVLFWGILGAIFMRLGFILAGVELVQRFEWITWVFGAFLVWTGLKLAMPGQETVDPERNFLLRGARRFFPLASEDHGQQFFAREQGRWCITPMALVLLVIESSDVLFAVDSVPAIFAVSRDPFILFTSNIFAILGLRALYFLLAGVMDLFRYLSYGLSAVLAFVGMKMMAEYWIAHEGTHLVPAWVSLAVVALLLSLSIGASVIAKWRETAPARPALLPGVQDK